MTSTARQLRQPPTIEAIERVPYFADNLKPDFPTLELKFNSNYYAYNCLLWYIPNCN